MKCIKCGEGKLLTDFDPIKKRQGDYMVCKKCQLMKKCSKCGISKNILDFHADKGNKDGFRSSCISCDRTLKKKNRFGDVKTASHVKIRRRLEENGDMKKINSMIYEL